MEKNKKQEPLKEKEDYGRSAAERVKKRFAAEANREGQERALYMAQDVEDYILGAGLSIRDLSEEAVAAIARELRRGPE